jgi:phage repressor protein C with HTH and peptisase S24 domain
VKTEAERYAYIQEKSGLSKKDFATSLGLAKSQGSLMSQGKLKASRETLSQMASLYHVDLTWFITGEGSPEIGPGGVAVLLHDQEAAAGQGREIGEYVENRTVRVPAELIAPHRAANVRAVYVAGDSMEGAGINDKDIIIFRPCQPEGNGIYVLSIGTTLLIKRVEFDPFHQSIILISANPAYPPREISGFDLETFKIEGRVIACLHRF